MLLRLIWTAGWKSQWFGTSIIFGITLWERNCLLQNFTQILILGTRKILNIAWNSRFVTVLHSTVLEKIHRFGVTILQDRSNSRLRSQAKMVSRGRALVKTRPASNSILMKSTSDIEHALKRVTSAAIDGQQWRSSTSSILQRFMANLPGLMIFCFPTSNHLPMPSKMLELEIDSAGLKSSPNFGSSVEVS